MASLSVKEAVIIWKASDPPKYENSGTKIKRLVMAEVVWRIVMPISGSIMEVA